MCLLLGLTGLLFLVIAYRFGEASEVLSRAVERVSAR